MIFSLTARTIRSSYNGTEKSWPDKIECFLLGLGYSMYVLQWYSSLNSLQRSGIKEKRRNQLIIRENLFHCGNVTDNTCFRRQTHSSSCGHSGTGPLFYMFLMERRTRFVITLRKRKNFKFRENWDYSLSWGLFIILTSI